MPIRLLPFSRLIDLLAQHYGKPAPPDVIEPFAMILWENVAYLASDTRRASAFAELRAKTGLTPAGVRKAKDSTLLAIAGKGILPAASLEKLRRAAEVAHDLFGDNLAPILDEPLAAAKRDLRKFPAIGEPAAEQILLFNHRHRILALESNGLRVLVRLGYAAEHKNYSTMYKGAQRALAAQLPDDCDALIRAYQLLRLHGQETCKRSSPPCHVCPVRVNCQFFLESASGTERSVGKRA
jgi:endonuclease III